MMHSADSGETSRQGRQASLPNLVSITEQGLCLQLRNTEQSGPTNDAPEKTRGADGTVPLALQH